MPAETHTSKSELFFASLLERSGIRLNGPDPWDIQVKDKQFFNRFYSGGSLALGESYMDGWWDVEELDTFFTRAFEAGIHNNVRVPVSIFLKVLFFRIFNPQGGRRAFQVGRRHYDTGNDLFEQMLGRHMVYSCGYWKEAEDLDAAQLAKLELICRKMELKAGMRLLDIGCGWGSLLKFAAEKYSVDPLGITVSEKQADFAQRLCAGLPVDVRVQDYRQIGGRFDAIASIGMAEHVGWKNYPEYMKLAHRCLEPGGLFALHTIGSNQSVRETDPWIARYIFPNSMLPSLAQLTRAAEPFFVVEDVQNFGPDYDRTLMTWDRNFRLAWPLLKDRYGERFYRMWRYYLMVSAASFRSRRIQLWQLVLAKKPRHARYDAVR
jgi:cyclopropane-fatty-acyl-phospholipid synthase